MNALSLASILTSRKGPYHDNTSEWVLLIRDHKEYIKQRSTLVTIAPDDLYKYQYMPGAYLYDTYRLSLSATWIFLFINDIPSVDDFKPGIRPVYIPAESTLAELYRLSCTLKAARKRSVTTV